MVNSVAEITKAVKPDPEGTFTIRQVLQFTNIMFPDRYSRRIPEKERLTGIHISEVTRYEWPEKQSLTPGVRVEAVPKKYYRIVSTLRPRHKVLQIGGNLRLLGKNIQSSYEIIFETDELSLDTKHWKIRLGSGRLWQDAPTHALASIPKIARERNVGIQEWLRTRSPRAALFMNKSDWNSLVLGINADFLFRCSFVYKKFGHLFGYTQGPANFRPPVKTNPFGVLFFPKHIINFFEVLMEMGVFTTQQGKAHDSPRV
jgi:hypothetical protein